MSGAVTALPAPTAHRDRPDPHAAAAIPVEVWSPFLGRWCGGFEVVGDGPALDGGPSYLVRRRSDGALLPRAFAADELRSA